MTVRLLGSELGRVERITQVPVLWVGLVREKEVSEVPRPSVLALVQVLIALKLLAPEVLPPMWSLARW